MRMGLRISEAGGLSTRLRMVEVGGVGSRRARGRWFSSVMFLTRGKTYRKQPHLNSVRTLGIPDLCDPVLQLVAVKSSASA
jgi:hypothetical protein